MGLVDHPLHNKTEVFAVVGVDADVVERVGDVPRDEVLAGHQRRQERRQPLGLQGAGDDEPIDQAEDPHQAVVPTVVHELRSYPGRPAPRSRRHPAHVPGRYPSRDLPAAPHLLRGGHPVVARPRSRRGRHPRDEQAQQYCPQHPRGSPQQHPRSRPAPQTGVRRIGCSCRVLLQLRAISPPPPLVGATSSLACLADIPLHREERR